MKFWLVDQDTREVLQEQVAVMKGGIYHIPKSALLIEPLPQKEGFVVVANDDLSGTEYIEDHRGKTVYNKQTRQRIIVEKIGALSEEFTELGPFTAFDCWNGSEWVTDESAKFIAEYDQVDNIRRNLYERTVDPLVAEANVKRLQGKEQEALDYERQALALRAKIQAESPYPAW